MTQHAIARFKERLGLDMTEADLGAIAATLGQPGTLLLGKDSHLRSIERWAVTVNGVPCVVLFSRKSAKIITVWRPDGWSGHKRRLTPSERKRLDRTRRLWARAEARSA